MATPAIRGGYARAVAHDGFFRARCAARPDRSPQQRRTCMTLNLRLALAAVAVGALSVGVVAPAGAQAPLGFTIAPTEGRPGDLVSGQVDPADVAEHCVTDVEGVQERFLEFGLVAAGEFLERYPDGPYPPGEFPEGQPLPTSRLTEFLAWTAYGLLGGGVSSSAENAELVLPQLFVMTFADVATQSPVGQIGSFDRTTGVGSVVVPDVAQGSWAVAAACVMPSIEVADIEGGVARASALWLEQFGLPATIDESNVEEVVRIFNEEILGCETDPCDVEATFTAFTLRWGPTLLSYIAEFDALGLQLFTVLPPRVNHFQCYDVRNVRFQRRSVTLTDVFGTRTAEVRRAADLCAPADENGEDPDAPGDADYLVAYQLKNGPFDPSNRRTVTNQFGSITLDVRQQRSLLVPSRFSASGPPASSPDGSLSHFTCYDVRVSNRTARFEPRTVSVQTDFDDVDVLVRKPTQLCVPANKNGETPSAPGYPESLLCYQTKVRAGAFSLPAFIANQFGQQTNTLRQRGDFCVPSRLGGSPAGAFVG